ncbi:MAG: DUF5348 domain-containing protein [Nitrospiraceae bacterium]|nr:DUF5348 domain-containing protein [Nitrospiraceae bacterium]
MREQGDGLQYDRDSERWPLDGVDLHCGDGLEVSIRSVWFPVRIEHDGRHGWILYADHDRCRILPSRSLPARPTPEDGRWYR